MVPGAFLLVRYLLWQGPFLTFTFHFSEISIFPWFGSTGNAARCVPRRVIGSSSFNAPKLARDFMLWSRNFVGGVAMQVLKKMTRLTLFSIFAFKTHIKAVQNYRKPDTQLKIQILVNLYGISKK